MALIKPDVYSNLMTQTFKNKVRVLNLAIDAGFINDFVNQGDSITFPSWVLGSEDTTDMTTPGTEVSPEELAQTSMSAPVKFEAKTNRVYDFNDKTSLGNAINESNRQHALVFARKLDSDLIAEVLTTTHYEACSAAATITEQELQSAMITAFGDELDAESFAGIVINSRLTGSFYDTAFVKSFTNANDTTAAQRNGIVTNGLLGFWRGIPIYVSDKGTYDSVNSECQTFIIKKNALAYKMKEGFFTEEERLPKLKATDVTSSMMYAVKLINGDGAVVIKKTVV